MLPRRLSQRAFTATELLVSLALLVIVAGLLLPVIARSRQATLQSRCASQLRQAVALVLAYAVDHRQTLLPRNDGTAGGHWHTVLHTKGYLTALPPENPLLACPAGPAPKQWSEAYGYRQWQGSLIKKDAPLAIARIPEPARFWLFADSARLSGGKLQQWYTIQDAGEGYAGFHLRHQENVNVAFLDGRVESLTREEALRLASPEPTFTKERLEVRRGDGQSVYAQ